MDSKMKRGQIAIWIMIGVVLIVAVSVYFFTTFRSEVKSSKEGVADFDYISIIKGCVGKEVETSLKIMLAQGGTMIPTDLVVYDGVAIEHVCKNDGTYHPCLHQHPMLIREMESELEGIVIRKMEECVEEIKYSAEGEGWDFESSDEQTKADVKLAEGKVEINIEKEIDLNKADVDIGRNEYFFEIESDAYGLAKIIHIIGSFQARYCGFPSDGYSISYPEYRIEKYSLSFPSNVYIIKNVKTGELAMTATRSCAIPTGLM